MTNGSGGINSPAQSVAIAQHQISSGREITYFNPQTGKPMGTTTAGGEFFSVGSNQDLLFRTRDEAMAYASRQGATGQLVGESNIPSSDYYRQKEAEQAYLRSQYQVHGIQQPISEKILSDIQKSQEPRTLPPMLPQREGEIGRVRVGEIVQLPDRRLVGTPTGTLIIPETTKPTITKPLGQTEFGYVPVDLNYLVGTPEAKALTQQYRESMPRFQVQTGKVIETYAYNQGIFLKDMFGGKVEVKPGMRYMRDMFGFTSETPMITGAPKVTVEQAAAIRFSEQVGLIGASSGFGGIFTTTSGLRGATLIQPGDFAAISRSLKMASSKAKAGFGEFMLSEEAAVPRRKVTQIQLLERPKAAEEKPVEVIDLTGIVEQKPTSEIINIPQFMRSKQTGIAKAEQEALYGRGTFETKAEQASQTRAEIEAYQKSQQPLSEKQLQAISRMEQLTGKKYSELRGVELFRAAEQVKLEMEAVSKNIPIIELKPFAELKPTSIQESITTPAQATATKTLATSIYKSLGIQIPIAETLNIQVPVALALSKAKSLEIPIAISALVPFQEPIARTKQTPLVIPTTRPDFFNIPSTPTTPTPSEPIIDIPIYIPPPEFPTHGGGGGGGIPDIPGLKIPKLPWDERKRRKAKGKAREKYVSGFRATPLREALDPAKDLQKSFAKIAKAMQGGSYTKKRRR